MRVAALFTVALLAGCQQADEPTPAPSAMTSAPASAAPQPTSTPLPKPTGKAVLDAEGAAFGPSASTVRRFAFGGAREEVETAAEQVFGRLPVRSSNGECGAGPMDFSKFGALTLNFQDGKLVGWLAESDPLVVTSDGIRPGTLFRDLAVARSATLIEDSTLEGEFDYLAADGKTIGGFVTGSGRDARIRTLYAGVNCFFR